MKAWDKKIPNHKSIENRVLNSVVFSPIWYGSGALESLGALYMERDLNPNVELDILFLDQVFTLK
jgi:hypothetical protein